MEKLEKKVYCLKCNILTNHNIVQTYEEKSEPGDDIQWHSQWHIVQCAGCDQIAFVEQYGDENQWVYIDGEQVWKDEYLVFPQQPPLVENNPKLWIEKKIFNNVPDTIDQLYSQVIEVYNKGYLLLATIGIRTIIEAICLDVGISKGFLYEDNQKIKLNKKDEQISSTSLEGKIFGLYEQNMIIWDQTIILQKIRDIGNAAVHEIKQPSITVFKSAVQIIEQVLNLVYELKVHKLLKK